MHSHLISTTLMALSSTASALVAHQLWEFPNATWIENIAIRPNGHLLLNTFDEGRIYSFDPDSLNSEPQLVTQICGVTGLTGIAELEPDYFAVTGGQLDTATFRFALDSLNVYTLDFRRGGTSCNGWTTGSKRASTYQHPLVRKVAHVTNTTMLNGMVSLPEYPHLALSIDSVGGRVFRVDTATGAVDVVLQDTLLEPSNITGRTPLGANGIRLRNNYLYFTNSGQRTFGRVSVSSSGEVLGGIQIMTDIEPSEPDSVADDDFIFDLAGNAFISRHPNFLSKIEPDGIQTIVLGAGNSTLLRHPTSAALSRDGTKLYVVTGGLPLGGQVIEVRLP